MPQDGHAYKQCDVMAFRHSTQVRTLVECHNALTQGTQCHRAILCILTNVRMQSQNVCSTERARIHTHARYVAMWATRKCV